jgi:hypothetical protein
MPVPVSPYETFRNVSVRQTLMRVCRNFIESFIFEKSVYVSFKLLFFGFLGTLKLLLN